jgi:hypothetical protein
MDGAGSFEFSINSFLCPIGLHGMKGWKSMVNHGLFEEHLPY